MLVLSNLEQKLDYTFKSKALLKQALVHASCHSFPDGVETHNERLEFLGDRVLGLHVSNMLYQTLPEEPEGKLAKRLAFLVRQNTLANIAKEWELGEYLFLGDGEANTGGRKKPTILSDAVEAIIAAIYLDGGFAETEKIVHKFWQPLIDESDEVDAKTALQEWLQARGEPLPEYNLIEQQGEAHNRRFVMEAKAMNYAAQGLGRSKQLAQQQAAAALLKELENTND